MEISITAGSADDIGAVVALRDALHWSQAGYLLDTLLATRGLLLCAREATAFVGCGSAVLYGEAGYIGNMIVADHLQGRGIGKRLFGELLDWLTAAGARRVELQATGAGLPLYERNGFVRRWQMPEGRLVRPPAGSTAASATGSPGIAGSVTALSASDWPEIVALDRRATDAARGPFLQRLVTVPDARALVLREAGRLTAFGMCFADRIGPLVADSPAAAETLATALLQGAAGGPRVTSCSPAATAVWERQGFALGPGDVRMVRGAAPHDQPDLVYAMISGVVG